jgi:hypothetical protein
MPPAQQQKEIAKVLASIADKVEVYIGAQITKHTAAGADAHFFEFLAKKYPTSVERKALSDKIDAVIRPTAQIIDKVPAGRKDSYYTKLTQYAYNANITPKALPRMPDVWERTKQLFQAIGNAPEGLKTSEEKFVGFFAQPPNKNLEENELCLRSGVCRWAAAMCIAITAVEDLEPAEVLAIDSILCSFGKIECTWDNDREMGSVMFKSISTKLNKAVTQRPDPEQLLTNFEVVIESMKTIDLANGKTLTSAEYVCTCINAYNKTQVAKSTKIDNYERCAIEWLADQLPATRQVVKEIWSGPGKYTESGLNFHDLSLECFKKGHCMITIAEGSPGAAQWRADCTTNEKGYLLWTMRSRNVFQANYEVTKAQARKNYVNLKHTAAKLRDPDLEKALTLCTWWGNREEELKVRLNKNYHAISQRFLRGPGP